MKNNYNIVLIIFIWMVIVRHIISIVSSIPLIIAWTSSDYISILAIGWNIILSISMIIILWHLLKEKKWSIYLFCGLQIINVVFQSIFLEGDFLNSLIIAITLCIIMAALLCLKKNGISAWKSLFSRNQGLSAEEQSVLPKIEDAVIEDNTDNLTSQNSEDKDSISTEQVKEHIEENIIPKESERVISGTTAINDEVEDVSLANLPYKEDGSIDYENMTSVQQFAYTSKTESIKVALMDLNTDIKILEKSIGSIQKELKSLQGGNRAMLRDSLRKEQEKLDELYELRSKYSSKNWLSGKGVVAVIICIIMVCFILLLCIKLQSTDNEGLYNNIEKQLLEENDAEIVFQNRKALYAQLVTDNYDLVDFDTFNKMLDSDSMRMELHSMLMRFDNNYNLGTYSEFSKNIYAENGVSSNQRKLSSNIQYADDLSELYDELIDKGYILKYESIFREEMQGKDFRQFLYDYIRYRNDFEIGEYDEYEKRVLRSLDMRWLYNQLSENYDIGDYNIFYEKMMSKEKSRKKIYDVAIEAGLDVGTWDEFNQMFGM